MVRAIAALACLVVAAPNLAAQEKEIEGEFVKYDKEKKILTLKVDDTEKEFPVTEETKLFTLAGQPNKRGIGGLGNFRKPGRKFKMKVEMDGEKIVVKEIRPQR